jgi:hypothetical protein
MATERCLQGLLERLVVAEAVVVGEGDGRRLRLRLLRAGVPCETTCTPGLPL